MKTMARKSKGEQAKEWRTRMEAENPEYMAQQRAKARERSRARYEAKKHDPEFIKAEQERKRASIASKRANPEFREEERNRKRAADKKPEAKAKKSARMKDWKAKNAAEVSEYQKVWRERNKEAVQQYNKSYIKAYVSLPEVKEKARERNLQRNYRLSQKDFNLLWSEQKGCCAVCSVQMSPRGKGRNAVCVDHNHDTGMVRGLLCGSCNRGIGCLRDSPEVIDAAAAYLRKQGHYGIHQITSGVK